MRENMGLYRGKRTDNGKWVEGYFVKSDGRINNGKCYILRDANNFRHSDGNVAVIGSFVEVDPSTVGEYTGLADRSGKRIFEGDVLREPAKNEWEKINFVGFEVFWHDNDSCDRHIGWQMNRLHFYGALAGADIYPVSFRPEWANRMEVIGNVHDNPELKGEC